MKRITWLHEVVYTTAGKAPSYGDMSLLLFVQGYSIVKKGVKEGVRTKMNSHLEELMGDTELYGWEIVRVYHAV